MPSVAATASAYAAHASATAIAIHDVLEIPLPIRNLADFCQWTHRNVFPRDGRIDFIGGWIDVDMSPDDARFHAAPKSELVVVLPMAIKRLRVGTAFKIGLRNSSELADLSCEPDLVLRVPIPQQSCSIPVVVRGLSGRDRWTSLNVHICRLETSIQRWWSRDSGDGVS